MFAAQAAVVEIDLIFPRNDTYAPGPFMPVVFAIQNSAMASSLDLAIVWNIFRLADPGGDGGVNGVIDLKHANLTRADPFFTTDYALRLNGTEAGWGIRFGLSFANCSKSAGPWSAKVTPNSENRLLLFSTKPGAPGPKFVQGPGTCVNSTGVAINVAETLSLPLTAVNNGHDSCLVLASPPIVDANPCAVTVNETTAATILGSFCGPDTATTCLPASRAPAQGIPILVSWFLPVFAGLVMYAGA
ncbi:hypothetical protein C8A05DRAFT_19712 [Staphylotrichum tortipilum]|uniref:DUF7136 domain-containing protein n=1 Tax=Staphylotrichum tortipilum TaxID=2831512 RepID=A0AAN6MBR8_9PEZI|nr:hypothetical protein C8A05DRAFT_19712 [Staphylotrichum longicolle]